MLALANCPTSCNDGDETPQQQALRLAMEAAQKELAKFREKTVELENLVVQLDHELAEWDKAIDAKEAPMNAASILANRGFFLTAAISTVKDVLKRLSNSR